MPSKDQITEIIPHVRTDFWITIWYKYHGLYSFLYCVSLNYLLMNATDNIVFCDINEQKIHVKKNSKIMNFYKFCFAHF